MKNKSVKYQGPNKTELGIEAAITYAEKLAEVQYKNFKAKAIELSKGIDKASDEEVWSLLRELENMVKVARGYKRSTSLVNKGSVHVLARMDVRQVPKPPKRSKSKVLRKLKASGAIK